MSVLIAVLLAVAAARAGELAKTFPAGMEQLTIKTEAGNVTVEAGGSDVRVEVTNHDPERCEITMTSEGGDVRLRAARKGKWFGRKSCRAGFKVKAPATLNLDAATVSGELSVEGFSGRAELKSVSGSIKVEGPLAKATLKTTSGKIHGSASGEVSARTISGDVALEGLTGPADAGSVSGEVRLAWAKAPAAGEVRVKTVSGDVDLVFPRGTKARTKLSTTSGETSNELGDYLEGGLKVTAKSVSGSLRLLAGKGS